MAVLFHCLRDIHAAMEGEAAYYFDQDLYYVADPVELATRNATVLLSDTRSLDASPQPFVVFLSICLDLLCFFM